MKGAFQACVQLLRLGANPNAHDLTNRNLVHLLMLFRGPGVRTVLPEMNNNELFKRLVNEKDNYGSTPLHYSTQMGNLGATQAFLLQGASALERDNERNTPLHTAAYFGRLHTCERLLDTGHGMRAMNSPDALGRLPLHVAVEQGHVNVVKLFLEKGCVFRKCHLGNTPLHYVAIGGCIKTCRILLQTNPSLLNQVNFHGGSPLEMTDRNGWTPLLLAAMKGAFQACVQLLRLGANPNAHDLTNRNLVHLLMLFRGPGVRTVLPEMNNNELFKRLVNEKDNYGSTPLHYSTQMGNLGATQAFLLQGASALERDNERNTPLHTAAYFGRLHTCERLLDTGHGMRAMNSPDALGRLPLHVAVEQGHVNVVKLFLEKGCVFRK
ncbi:hypothetical protein AHF37_09271 [Paragonimus kellicotti]|nr:hypothetical protein AHF37_09271 [Paragonimus kellicotti]